MKGALSWPDGYDLHICPCGLEGPSNPKTHPARAHALQTSSTFQSYLNLPPFFGPSEAPQWPQETECGLQIKPQLNALFSRLNIQQWPHVTLVYTESFSTEKSHSQMKSFPIAYQFSTELINNEAMIQQKKTLSTRRHPYQKYVYLWSEEGYLKGNSSNGLRYRPKNNKDTLKLPSSISLSVMVSSNFRL